MRVVVVGPAAARARLVGNLPEGMEVVAEVRTAAEARSLGLTADAWLVVPSGILSEDESDTVEPLTPRELEVVELVAQGLSNKSIGARLGISDQTVKFHVASICGKLGAANRTEVSRKALHLGLIPL